MKFKKTKITAFTLATAMLCGSLAGCGLVTTDLKADLGQTIATVDISLGEEFKEGGEYSAYADTISEAKILKRDLQANYATVGTSYVNAGSDPEYVYNMLKSSLVNRQIFLQYAQVYFFKHDSSKTVDGYKKAVEDAAAAAAQKYDGMKEKDALVETDKQTAGLAYFLDEDEKLTAEYNLKLMFNNSLDSQETAIIEAEADEHDHDTARTTPTGVATANEDFYDIAYEIYTGSNSPSACGTYETVDGSTPTTRKDAYKAMLSNLNYYGLVLSGENTSDIATLTYYALERRMQYESQLINKLADAFEEEAAANITESWIESEKFGKTIATQKEQFGGSDSSALTSALDSVSDTSFVFYAPEGYGFVINILLPFSTLQTQELNDSHADLGDTQGNKFVKRSTLLKGLTATDQRKTWFTGHDDFSYLAESADNAYTGGKETRKYLFFEDNMKRSSGENAQYEPIKNYYGKYTYNGIVTSEKDDDGDTVYSFQPEKIDINGFLAEMESYLNFADLHLTVKTAASESYFDRKVSDYYKEENGVKSVDYSQFLYYEAKIDELADFDYNRVFDPTSTENKAMSVMNELSFAYNTDTAGLNSYLGYAVSPNDTDFVKEFEYAAQQAVRGGAGTITVAPSDYGWHIMYCTFAYDGTSDIYSFDWAQKDSEGTFSNLYYEALKADNFEVYANAVQTSVINSFDNDTCVTVYEDRYKDLWQV